MVPVKKIELSNSRLTVYLALFGNKFKSFDLNDVQKVKLTRIYLNLILFEIKQKNCQI
jgi:hypothetical protein